MILRVRDPSVRKRYAAQAGYMIYVYWPEAIGGQALGREEHLRVEHAGRNGRQRLDGAAMRSSVDRSLEKGCPGDSSVQA